MAGGVQRFQFVHPGTDRPIAQYVVMEAKVIAPWLGQSQGAKQMVAGN